MTESGGRERMIEREGERERKRDNRTKKECVEREKERKGVSFER